METSLRVEIPPSTLSPGLRARTKTAISCWRPLTGKPLQAAEDEGRPAVGAGRGLGRDRELVVRRGGRVHERALHGAAAGRGDVEADDERRRPAGDDPRVAWSVSTRSRAGGEIVATWSGLPPAGQPGPRDGAGAAARWITVVGTEVELPLPSELPAVTRRRSVAPTSAEVSR